MDAVIRHVIRALSNEDGNDIPPGAPVKRKYTGPWLETQLALSCGIGLFSFMVFCWCRTRMPVLFAPRTKLKGFSPHEAHAHSSFFAWILPTIRTSEFTVLQIVGLDAAVLLNFFKMAFYLFTTCSVLALCILMPANFSYNDGSDDDDDDDDKFGMLRLLADPPKKKPSDWLDLINDANSIHTLHLIFTYAFTLLTLRFLYKNYQNFIRSRQLYSLQLVHSVAARTIIVTDLPNYLRGEHALAVHFENMNLPVESVSLCRALGPLEGLIEKRTDILLQLEESWTKYVGNPSSVEAYDPSLNIHSDLSTTTPVDVEDEEIQRNRLVVPHQSRPTIRPKWFGKKVDALEYLQARFQEADEAVRRKRRSAKLKATETAFVTFETMASAVSLNIPKEEAHNGLPTLFGGSKQVAAQAVSASGHKALAPEPRDIIWSNMAYSRTQLRIRQVVVMGLLTLLFFFWLVPVSLLASLLSYEELKRATPWLVRLIDKSPSIQTLVQNTLPSTAIMLFNGLLPFLLETLSYIEGHKARSLIEYSLLKKYFLFLLINVVFIFLLASTYWALVRDLANSPGKIPAKLAEALRKGQAKKFFVSYVVLQAFGVMPLQLLNLGTIVPRIIYQMFWIRTPRDFAELNAPPMINYGAVYPQAILIFIITLLYSVIQPLVLVFGAAYFGFAYVVYKYKLLFVFYKPYESRGEAWTITFNRLVWGVIIFQIFMIGVFTLSQSFVLSSLMAPLLIFTVSWAWYMDKEFTPLSQYINLDSVYEVQRGETDEMSRLGEGQHVSTSHTNLSRRRYAPNDDTLYVAPEETRTDYSQPPMGNFYYGVLNTGKRRYGHPALNGVLPQPWLPLKKGQTLANFIDRDTEVVGTPMNGARKKSRNSHRDPEHAVVLTLRRRYSVMRGKVGRLVGASGPNVNSMAVGEVVEPPIREDGTVGVSEDTKPASEAGSNPWHDTATGPSAAAPSASYSRQRRLSYDFATGVMNLPDDDGEWMGSSAAAIDEDGDSDTDIEVESGLSGGTTPSPAEADHGTSALPNTVSETQGLRHRVSTYWHHPERRNTKRASTSFPGSFPT